MLSVLLVCLLFYFIFIYQLNYKLSRFWADNKIQLFKGVYNVIIDNFLFHPTLLGFSFRSIPFQIELYSPWFAQEAFTPIPNEFLQVRILGRLRTTVPRFHTSRLELELRMEQGRRLPPNPRHQVGISNREL